MTEEELNLLWYYANDDNQERNTRVIVKLLIELVREMNITNKKLEELIKVNL